MADRIIARSLAALALLVGGCFQPMKPSPAHLPGFPGNQEQPAPEASRIPAPVPMTTVLPKPRATTKQETYSVVVNNVRVHELLFALARDARLNVDIHPGISGTVTLNAIDQTLPQLLSRIARQVDMRYELDGPNLAVMPDAPFLRLYKIDYVNMERQTTGTVSVAAQIAGAQTGPGQGGAGGGIPGGGGGGAQGSGVNASTVTIRNTSSNRFWTTLVQNVEELLRETDKVLPGASGQGGAGPQQVALVQPNGQAAGQGTPGAPGALPTPPNVPAIPNVQFREAASVIANPEAGVLSIRATSRQHEKIQEFLDAVMVSAKRQVLIEATIVEVRLNNQYQQGIDWAYLGRGAPSGFRWAQRATGEATATPTASILTGNYDTNTINATLKLLESFGTTRVLSSPRLSVLNNQSAILKVVENLVYFTITSSSNATANVSTTGITSTPHTIPVGFVMNITAQISEGEAITLNLKPTISKVAAFVEDPNPLLKNPCLAGSSTTTTTSTTSISLINAGTRSTCGIDPIVSRIPQVQTREMESLIRVMNGQIAVMGGLIQDEVVDREDSIPGLNRIPGLGQAFGNHNKQNAKSELVVFLRPVIVRDPSIDGDYRGYRVLLPRDDFLLQPNPGRPAR